MENPIKMDDLGIPLFSETPNIGDTPIFHEKPHDYGRKVAFSGAVGR